MGFHPQFPTIFGVQPNLNLRNSQQVNLFPGFTPFTSKLIYIYICRIHWRTPLHHNLCFTSKPNYWFSIDQLLPVHLRQASATPLRKSAVWTSAPSPQHTPPCERRPSRRCKGTRFGPPAAGDAEVTGSPWILPSEEMFETSGIINSYQFQIGFKM